MTTELAIIEQEPEEIVIRGQKAAAQLQKVIGSKEKKLMLGGKQYLFFEDWQTIGKFYGVTAQVKSTEELREDGKLVGFSAYAVALAGGIEVSGAESECCFDEPNWNGKPRFQLRSMAQTRACAKSLRNCLGWVAVLAGYEATPAEEMTETTQPQVEKATPAQLGKIVAVIKEKGYSRELAMSIMTRLYNIGSSKELTKSQASEFIQKLIEGYMLEDQIQDKDS